MTPLVKESRIRMECRLVQVVSFGDGGPGSGSTVFGEVVLFHAEDGLVSNFRIDARLLRPIGRMGGPQYCRATDTFEMPRPGTGGTTA